MFRTALSRTSAASLAMAALSLGASTHAQILLGPPSDIPIADGGIHVLTGDLDEDGHLDLIVAPGSPSLFGGGDFRFTTIRGVGDGSFDTLVSTEMGGGLDFLAEGVLVDVDNDDNLDWVAAGHAVNPIDGSEGGIFRIWHGGGDLSFPLRTDHGLQGNSSSQALVVDLTGDPMLDVLLAESSVLGGSRLDAFVADGGAIGGFVEGAGLTLPTGVQHVSVGYFNNDNLLDMAVASDSVLTALPSELNVYLATSATTWAAGVSYAVGARPFDVEACDVDSDGELDLLVIDWDAGMLQFYKGAGDGSFASAVNTPVAGTPRQLAVQDLNADGHLDLVITHGAAHVVSVLQGVGDGSFALAQSLSNMNDAAGLALGDFDGDGDCDIAVARSPLPFGSATLSIVLNETYASGSPFAELGAALAGTNGLAIHVASGDATAGSPVSFDLYNSVPSSLSFLVVGLSQVDLSFYGGTLVPAPDAILARFSDATGHAQLAGPWPSGVPSGSELFAQWWFEDAGAVFGYAASNAVGIDVP